MANWQARYTELVADMRPRVVAARRFIEKYNKLLLRYKGGLHVGFLAAIAGWESGGRPDLVGDRALGEYGLFQVAEHTEDTFDVPRDTRKSIEGNIFLAALEYNVEARRLALADKTIRSGSADQWLLARLVFAVGRNGTNRLLAAAADEGYLKMGNIYEGLMGYIDTVGGVALGSQSAGKVWLRVKSVSILFEIGKQAAPNATMGPPMKLPSPRMIAYRLPRDVREAMPSELGVAVASVGTLTAGLLLPGV